MDTWGEGIGETLSKSFGQEDGVRQLLEMFVFEVFVEVVEPVVNVGPLPAFFELFELGMDVLLEVIWG